MMSQGRANLQYKLQFAGIVACAVACLVFLFSIYRTDVANAGLQAQCDAVDLRTQEATATATTFDHQLQIESDRLKQLYSDIKIELEKREKVTLEMADVMAKAKQLQVNQESFEAKRREVMQSLKRLDAYYERMKAVTEPH
jgi:hypothetical protein